DLRLAPTIRRGDDMDLAQHAERELLDLGPEERRDVEARRRGTAAGRTLDGELEIRLRVRRCERRVERREDVVRKVANLDHTPARARLDHAPREQLPARAVAVGLVCALRPVEP